MRSLSITFLFVLMGFLIYSSMMLGASGGFPQGFFILNGSDAASTPAGSYNSTIPLPVERIANSSLVSSVDGLFTRFSSVQISGDELYSGIELAVKLSLVVVLLSMSLYLLTSLVVR